MTFKLFATFLVCLGVLSIIDKRVKIFDYDCEFVYLVSQILHHIFTIPINRPSTCMIVLSCWWSDSVIIMKFTSLILVVCPIFIAIWY